MFEGLAKALSEEIRPMSRGKLNCLPYSRALLDFFDTRGLEAQPLVIRAVVFGRQQQEVWDNLPLLTLFRGARDSIAANGRLEVGYKMPGTQTPQDFVLPYRTLGHTHGNAPLGDYDQTGSWSGHLAIVVKNTLIDLTLGQLNDPAFRIDLSPPYVTVQADAEFLAAKRPLMGVRDGMLVCYEAFPDEKTHLQAQSWSETEFRRELQQAGQRLAEKLKGLSDEEIQAEELKGYAPPASAAPAPRSNWRPFSNLTHGKRKDVRPSPRERAEQRKKERKRNKKKGK